MRKFMTIAVGAMLLATTPLAASAQSQSGPMGRPGDQRPASDQGHHPGVDRPGMTRPGMEHPGMDRPGMHNGDYGHWNNGWGRRPPPPPRHFNRRGHWYQHVRACSARYRSYNPRTDTYQIRRGVYRTCRL